MTSFRLPDFLTPRLQRMFRLTLRSAIGPGRFQKMYESVGDAELPALWRLPSAYNTWASVDIEETASRTTQKQETYSLYELDSFDKALLSASSIGSTETLSAEDSDAQFAQRVKVAERLQQRCRPWNSHLQRLMDTPTFTSSEVAAKSAALSALTGEFVAFARELAELIVRELNLTKRAVPPAKLKLGIGACLCLLLLSRLHQDSACVVLFCLRSRRLQVSLCTDLPEVGDR
jgi:hypothetical protein